MIWCYTAGIKVAPGVRSSCKRQNGFAAEDSRDFCLSRRRLDVKGKPAVNYCNGRNPSWLNALLSKNNNNKKSGVGKTGNTQRSYVPPRELSGGA